MGFGVDLQCDLAPGFGGERIFVNRQIARHQCEQIRRLFERVMPADKMAISVQLAALHRVAVGQQHGITVLVRLHRRGEFGHDIGPIQIISNLAETLGFALGAEITAGLVQAFQRGIVFRVDFHLGLNGELLGRSVDGQRFIINAECILRQHRVIQRHPVQGQLLAIQHQRAVRGQRRVAAHVQRGNDRGFIFAQLKMQLDAVDEKFRRGVISQTDDVGRGLGTIHDSPS